jgi:hypothetical protein
MDNVEMDFTDLSKEATTEAILMEGTLDSPSSAQLEEVFELKKNFLIRHHRGNVNVKYYCA